MLRRLYLAGRNDLSHSDQPYGFMHSANIVFICYLSILYAINISNHEGTGLSTVCLPNIAGRLPIDYREWRHSRRSEGYIPGWHRKS